MTGALDKLIEAVEAGDAAEVPKANRAAFSTPCQDMALQLREENCREAFKGSWKKEREQMQDALLCLSGGMTFLQTSQGRSRSIKGLGNVINDGARDAGLVDRTAHGLRKARLTMIAEGGGSVHAIVEWGGHETLAEAQRYTRATDLKRLVLGTEQDQSEGNAPDTPVNFQ
ncbi:tyrosine-type recombinase/integrase [Paracoccus beibuensis]|uniref:tyrosine-type recombinase/integrase n=1 Tax=Paracoccus beibuensis TaxID=547602 RepID=UPI00224026C9|nr:hypothetical protein [Paracoccus beibuensis]